MSTVIEGTNDSSILSKYSMVSKGYFTDSYIQCFAPKLVRRAPLINIGYYVRAIIVDSVLNFYLGQCSKIQVVSLGAGFDTSFFRVAQSQQDIVYFEVDHVTVVKNKIQIILDNPELLHTIGNFYSISDDGNSLVSPKYVIFAQDLNDTEQFERALDRFGFDGQVPTILLSECAITYLEEDKSTNLIKLAATKCSRAVFLTYEQIQPNDSFGSVMTNHFDKLNCSLKSIYKYANVKEQEDRYLSCGWERCRAVTAMELFFNMHTEQERVQCFSKEPFDEWEELYLKCAHYTLTIALNGPFKYPDYAQPTTSISSHWNIVEWRQLNSTFCRVGHAVVPLQNTVFLVGGFGCRTDVKEHSRIKEVAKFDLTQEKFLSCTSLPGGIVWDCIHSSAVPVGDSFILFGGRTSPLRAVNSVPSLISVSDTGTTFNVELLESDKPVPKPRWKHSAALLQSQLIIFGGRTSDLQILNDLWTFDLNLKIWFERISGPCPRFSHCMTEASSSVYLSGGLDSALHPLGDIWELRLVGSDFVWCQIKLETNLQPRFGHTSHFVGGYLVLLGGVGAAAVPELTLVQISSGKVLHFQLPSSSPESPLMLVNHRSVRHDDGLFVFGGGGNCFSFGTHFNRHPLFIKLPSIA